MPPRQTYLKICPFRVRRLRAISIAVLGIATPLKAANVATWLGNSNTGGDGTNWTNADNWITNGVVDTEPGGPLPGDDVTIGKGTVGTISLDGNQFANSLNFTAGFTLGPVNDQDTFDVESSTISVASGITATINSQLVGNGRTVVGPGTLVLNGAILDADATTVASGTLILNSTAPPGGELSLSNPPARSSSRPATRFRRRSPTLASPPLRRA